MFATDDTIVAIATPHGRGALGIVRLSGPAAASIVMGLIRGGRPLLPRVATWAQVQSDDSSADAVLDEVVVTYFPGPRSATGQDVVEVSAHGSPVVLDGIVRGAVALGARPAAPGEFTLRSFLNGRRDLVRCEAVRDLIDAETPLQARVAFDQLDGGLTRRIALIESRLFDLIARLEASLDFPDEGYRFVERRDVVRDLDAAIHDVDTLLASSERGRVIRDGATVAIVGRTNVGKSSLFNRLVGSERAIVTASPGTTRDLITERMTMSGISLTLADTAGRRESSDDIEREGIARAAEAIRTADLTVVVIDGSRDLSNDDVECFESCRHGRHVVAFNKCDLPTVVSRDRFAGSIVVSVSAREARGIEDLRTQIVIGVRGDEDPREHPVVSNIRHRDLLRAAREALGRTRRSAAVVECPEELLLTELHEAQEQFGEILGRRTTDDLLRHIFERFCIGK